MQTLDSVPERFTIEGNTLTFHPKRAPYILLGFFYFITAVMLFGPTIGFFTAMTSGYQVSLKAIFGIAAFAFLGFYMLRVALWNTYGKEIIQIGETTIEYHGDYKYFVFNRKSYAIDGTLYFTPRRIGYEEDNLQALTIKTGSGNWTIDCSTKVPSDEIEMLLGITHEAFNGRVEILENTEE